MYFLIDVSTADFARRNGSKDKSKRKSRGYIGMYRGLNKGEKAGIVAGIVGSGVGNAILQSSTSPIGSGMTGGINKRRAIAGAGLALGSLAGVSVLAQKARKRKEKMGYKTAIFNPFRKDS